jgi:hypothetical protein
VQASQSGAVQMPQPHGLSQQTLMARPVNATMPQYISNKPIKAQCTNHPLVLGFRVYTK